ncbi:MAG: endonuclease domain-containing protein, partial [Alphaproteobacteria bacterium]
MLKDFAPAPQGGKVRQARKLRKAMTLPEGLVGRLLRSRPFGLKFRRQHPTGAFVLDFYCIDARLAVEIDGLAHDMGNRPARDIERDRWLRLHG